MRDYKASLLGDCSKLDSFDESGRRFPNVAERKSDAVSKTEQ